MSEIKKRKLSKRQKYTLMMIIIVLLILLIFVFFRPVPVFTDKELAQLLSSYGGTMWALICVPFTHEYDEDIYFNSNDDREVMDTIFAYLSTCRMRRTLGLRCAVLTDKKTA